MSCRAWVPFGLLALLTFRVADLWRAGELDPITLALLPVAAVMVVWLVRQPGSCSTAECAVEHDVLADTDADVDAPVGVGTEVHEPAGELLDG